MAKFTCPTPGATVAGDDVERKCVPFEGKAKGSSKAVVTIVEFSEFQCPYCSRVQGTIEKILKEYPDKVRFFFRHNPLPFHADAPLASQAAVAADKQGKFWPMHDILFKNQQNLKRPDLEKYAAEIGLDMAKFKKDIDDPATKKRVDDDLELGKKLGVQGTPNFFVNGRPIRGAVPFEQFKSAIDDELARGKKLQEKGTAASKVFAALMKGEGKGLGTPTPPAPPPRIPIGSEIYKIEPGDAPQVGGKEPKITLITFSEFQCPYCSRAKGTLDELKKIYKDDLQITFRHYPLPFHNNATPAAIAAVAAAEQGKFWEMHDKLFANQQALAAADLEKYAGEIGLDMAKYKAAIDNPKIKAKVEADTKMGSNFGVQGTPSFFLNGRAFCGAYPLESFKNAIDEEIKKVDAKLASGTPRAGLYAGAHQGRPRQGHAEEGRGASGRAVPDRRLQGRGQGRADQGRQGRAGHHRAVLGLPVPVLHAGRADHRPAPEGLRGQAARGMAQPAAAFHNNAKPAAIAAAAAQQQGKFWEMHALLFKNQSKLGAEDLEGYAKELGLNMTKFKAAMADKKLAEQVDAEAAMGSKIGARGTPAFFINGRFLSGAQPLRALQVDHRRGAQEGRGAGQEGRRQGQGLRCPDEDRQGRGGRRCPGRPVATRRPGRPRRSRSATPRPAAPRTRPSPSSSSPTSSAPSAAGSSRPSSSSRRPTRARCGWRGRTCRSRSTRTPSPPPRRPSPRTSRASSGRCTRSSSRTSVPSRRRISRSTPRRSGSTWASSRRPWTATSSPPRSTPMPKQGESLGVSGTPAAFVNGRLVSGAQPPEEFKKVAEAALKDGAKPKGKAN